MCGMPAQFNGNDCGVMVCMVSCQQYLFKLRMGRKTYTIGLTLIVMNFTQ